MKYRFAFLLVILSFISEYSYSQTQYPLYGYFFYTIAKNIEWPDQYKTGDFIIGVVGQSDATPHLKLMAMKKNVAGRPIKIVEFSSVNAISNCHMLLLPEGLSDQIASVLKKTNGKSVLLVTEKVGMARKGSSVNFVSQNGRLGFELNKAALDENDLKASSELSKFAIVL